MSRKISIGEASKLLNISNELLRHYERKGLITPYRDANGYRSYGIRDIHVLLGIRRFRNMGFSLGDIEALIYGASYQETQEMLSQRCKALEEEIRWQQLVLDATQTLMEESQNLAERNRCCFFCKNPAMLRISGLNGVGKRADTIKILQWVDKMPVVWISPSFTKEDVLEGREKIQFGYAVPLHLAEPLGLSSTPGAVEMPAVNCVAAVVNSSGDTYLSAKDLDFVPLFLREQGFRLCGDPWGLTIGNYTQDGKQYRFHKIFLPFS